MLSIREQALGKKVEMDAERYLKAYRPQVETLESKSLLSKVRPITPYDIYALGKMLESWDIYKQLCEEDGTLSQLGKIPDVAFDVITVAYGTSPIGVCASVQPIDEERGSVYYKKVVAQTTRGGVTAGDSLYDALGATDGVPAGYTSDRVTETEDSVDGTTDYNITLSGVPMRPFQVNVTAPDGSGGQVTAQDNGEGLLIGYDCQGTINYQTGALVLNLANNPGAETGGIIVEYSQDFEAAADLPKIIMKLATKSVNARVHALKDTIGLEQSYALRRRFGMIAEDEVATDLISAINSELMNTLVMRANGAAIGNVNFDKTAPSGVSYFEHKQSFKDKLAEAESNILAAAGRGTISVAIAGRSVCTIIGTLPGFTKISDGTTIGPHIYGTLDGTTIVRIPSTNVLDANTMLGLYKGGSPFEAGLVYAPYMPLVVTSALPTGANPLVNQKAAAVWAAVEALVPQFVTKLTVTAS